MNTRNPSRRNRNIGTAKQGHGQNNRMVIPESGDGGLAFFEKLENVVQVQAEGFNILVERTRQNSIHACTVEDLLHILKLLPKQDLGDLNWIVLRQPKRKEEILSRVWGRLVYAFEWQKTIQPAIVLESVDNAGKLIFNKKMSISVAEEFARLQQDGHEFLPEKRAYIARFQLNAIRNTQLFRTLFHELGHYVHYQQQVLTPPSEDDSWEALDARRDLYFKIPSNEKERFAHDYAESMASALRVQGKIPFPRILHEGFLQEHGLKKSDFDENLGI